MSGGLSAPHHPPGLRPWTPHAFRLRILVGTGSISTVFQQKTLKIKYLTFKKISYIFPKKRGYADRYLEQGRI